MNLFPMSSSVKVWLATGHTDMRCGFPTLALRVQEILKHDPLAGHLFCLPGTQRPTNDIEHTVFGLRRLRIPGIRCSDRPFGSRRIGAVRL